MPKENLMENARTTIAGLFCFLLIAMIAGCGDGKLQLGQVTGVVTINGKPLQAGQIVFVTETRRAFGVIENGKIKDVTTYETGDGVTLGTHRIAIRPKVDEAEMMKPPSQRKPDPLAKLVPPKFHNVDSSELTAEIKSGSNELNIELTSS